MWNYCVSDQHVVVLPEGGEPASGRPAAHAVPTVGLPQRPRSQHPPRTGETGYGT